jgi:hypothetical protein
MTASDQVEKSFAFEKADTRSSKMEMMELHRRFAALQDVSALERTRSFP